MPLVWLFWASLRELVKPCGNFNLFLHFFALCFCCHFLVFEDGQLVPGDFLLGQQVVNQELQLDVVYGDTDSVFVNTKTSNFQQAMPRPWLQFEAFDSCDRNCSSGYADGRTNQAICEQEVPSIEHDITSCERRVKLGKIVEVQETWNWDWRSLCRDLSLFFALLPAVQPISRCVWCCWRRRNMRPWRQLWPPWIQWPIAYWTGGRLAEADLWNRVQRQRSDSFLISPRFLFCLAMLNM